MKKLLEAAHTLRKASDLIEEFVAQAPTIPQWEPGNATNRAEHDALHGDIAKTWPAVTIPPMTVRGLPTPQPKFKVGDRVRFIPRPECPAAPTCAGTVVSDERPMPYSGRPVVDVNWDSGATADYEVRLLALDATTPQPVEPKAVEPQAGQVWVELDDDQDSAFAYVLTHLNGQWQAINLNGCGYWRAPWKSANRAVCGLTYAAPSVAEYYQRELRGELSAMKYDCEEAHRENERLAKRVAELEEERESKPSHKTALRCLRSALNPTEPAILSESQAALSHEMGKLIGPALAKAREEGAQAARLNVECAKGVKP